MGRPRKRKLSYDDGEIQTSATDAGTDPDLAAIPDMQPQVDGSFSYQNPDASSNSFATGELEPSFPAGLPTPPSVWPYFPFSPEGLQSPEPSKNTNGNCTHHSNSHGSPQCTCLSYIYLCLSTLSNLPPFPTSSNTLSTLHAAARTARAAIECPECPLGFATSMQNVMLLGTLFNVIGDGWLRVSRSDARELGMHCAPESYAAFMPEDPVEQQEFWRHWQRQIVRRGVIGGQFDPEMYTADLQCEETPDLLSLIKEMEDRQKTWHELGISKFQASGGMKACEKLHVHEARDHEGHSQLEERDFLCLRIVGSARNLLERFDFQPQDYPSQVS